jgi:hypothetical protein
MKRFACLFLLIVFACSFAQAQKFDAGISFGLTPSQVDGDAMTGYNKIGFNAGAFVKLDQGNIWVYQMDIAYTTKGSRQASSKNMDYSRPEILTSYVDFVLSAGYKITDKITLKAGLTPSVLITQKEQTTGGMEIIREENPFRPFNLLAMGGLNYSFGEHWSFNLAYNYSILSIRKGGYKLVDLDVKVENAQYHNYITLNLYYQF